MPDPFSDSADTVADAKQKQADIRARSASLIPAEGLSDAEAFALLDRNDLDALMAEARARRDVYYGGRVTYSPKVFIPLTHLCRDVCHYCTFAKSPSRLTSPFLSEDEVLEIARRGAEAGCREALFTLGDRPESRYRVAREALADAGFESTLHYLAHVAERVWRETGLLPHLNPGVMNSAELAMLRPHSVSMGIMLESASDRLCERGQVHFGSPDKLPERRLECIAAAGALKIPFTSGILIGIGETRRERIESLLALRSLHLQYGHLQEVIVQNFRAKSDTLMADSTEPTLDDFLWTLSAARLILPIEVNLQAPPNLSPDSLLALHNAGINDWGGVSPVTADFVNPEAPWPEIERLRQVTAANGQILAARLATYPSWVRRDREWIDSAMRPSLRRHQDSEGYARENDWTAGRDNADSLLSHHASPGLQSAVSDGHVHSSVVRTIIDRAIDGEALAQTEVVRLFAARGFEVELICEHADQLRQQASGDELTYVVNRNINYTNMCYFSCRFCAFSKGDSDPQLRGAAYDLPLDEITRRVAEAWARGATEVCLQGGIHPNYTGQTYLDICEAIKETTPGVHIHAFSPLEIWHGATTLKLTLEDYLQRLKSAGLASLPGTAAEILDDDIRALICPDKINTDTWLDVMRAAHSVGLRSTATIMFGHLEAPEHWARHLLRVRKLQMETGGFTEFVPLPFVHMEAPIHRSGATRPGPTWREALLMHAVARLALNPAIENIQASWVKLGANGVARCAQAGVNDLGGSLMNESITRAAGASHGEEFSPQQFEQLAASTGRPVRQRTTLYDTVDAERSQLSLSAASLEPVVNSISRRPRSPSRGTPVRFGSA